MQKQRQQHISLLSILIPTYDESQNILRLLEEIKDNLLVRIPTEIIVVDDNSPDKTGKIVEYYTQAINKMIESKQIREQQSNGSNNSYSNCSVKVVHRTGRYGLVSAIMEGIKSSTGDYILIMDADFSHSPEIIPKIIRELEVYDTDIVVASRYTEGGSIVGWPVKRRLISKTAIKIAQIALGVQKEVTDPMSGFFAFKRQVMDKITINTSGYKVLLEILIKSEDRIKVKEIPYTFVDRRAGVSKLGSSVMLEYVKSVGDLYRYQRKQQREIKKRRETITDKQLQKHK